MRHLARIGVFVCALTAKTLAHGDHPDHAERPEDWALWHLQEEHHIDNFDAPSFFMLHDFNSDGCWTRDEIYRFYGFGDESLKDTSEEMKTKLVAQVVELLKADYNGCVTRNNFVNFINSGQRLPDFGLGPGHHGDDEYEYEIHHFEKFHGDDATEEELTHPEDIAHFRKHDQMEDEEIRVEKEQQQTIVEANIPAKFRKQQ